jgi:hypothetical protein
MDAPELRQAFGNRWKQRLSDMVYDCEIKHLPLRDYVLFFAIFV